MSNLVMMFEAFYRAVSELTVLQNEVPEAISQKRLTLGVCYCQHRLQSPREPLGQILAKSKMAGLQPAFHWSICRGTPQVSGASVPRFSLNGLALKQINGYLYKENIHLDSHLAASACIWC